jgi:hypothetical protein
VAVLRAFAVWRENRTDADPAGVAPRLIGGECFETYIKATMGTSHDLGADTET